MTDTTEAHRQITSARLRALEIVLLSHMMATEGIDPGTVDIAARIAKDGLRQPGKGWPALVATFVADLFDQAGAGEPFGSAE